jgi:hypothetical protein
MSEAETMLKILHTDCGPVSMSCATCAHSTFVRGNLQSCDLDDGRQVDEDDDCGRWSPMVVAGPGCFFGTDHGQLEEV